MPTTLKTMCNTVVANDALLLHDAIPFITASFFQYVPTSGQNISTVWSETSIVKKSKILYMSSCYRKQKQQIGGGACKLCGSPGTNQTTCPLNPKAQNPNLGKHPLAAHTPRLRAAAASAPAVRKPAAPRVTPGKMIKAVTTKGYGTTDRLSAGEYYRKYGPTAVGQICDIRGNGDLRCLLLRKNGIPYWAKPSKSGKGQESCGTWQPSCREQL